MVAFIGNVLAVMLSLVGAIAAILLLALCTPVRVRGSISKTPSDETAYTMLDAVTWYGEMRWLLGMVRVRTRRSSPEIARHELQLAGITVGGSRERKTTTKSKQRKKDDTKEKRPKRKQKRLPQAAVIGAIRSEFTWFARRIWHAFSGRLDGEVTYGFDDPALTGVSHGLATALPMPRRLQLIPHYGNACLHGSVAGELRAYPIAFVTIGARGLFRPGIRRLWWPRLRARLRFTRTATN